MKTGVIIAVAVVAVAALTFGVINFVRAEQLPFAGNQAVAQGWLATKPGIMGGQSNDGVRSFMDKRDGFSIPGKTGRGMMGGVIDNARGHGMQILGEYHVAALAEKMGMTEEAVNSQLQDGKTMLDLAAEKGMTVEEYITLREDVRILAIDKALEAGVISQNQADWMKENMAEGMRGFGNW